VIGGWDRPDLGGEKKRGEQNGETRAVWASYYMWAKGGGKGGRASERPTIMADHIIVSRRMAESGDWRNRGFHKSGFG